MNSKIELVYISRYSETDKPDKQGRWARKCFFKELHIAWVSRVETEKGVKFIINPHFPITGNDCPNAPKLVDSFEEAKIEVERLWDEFLLICQTNNTI